MEWSCLSIDFKVRTNFWKHSLRNVKDFQNLVIPLEFFNVIKHGTSRIGVVGHVSRTVSQFPNQPSINGTKEQFTFFCSLLSAFYMVQYPTNLGSREVSIDDQTSLFVEFFHIALAFQLFSQRCCLTWLPNDSIVDRKTCFLIPDDSCFTLVGNPDCFNLVWLDTTFDESSSNNRLDGVPNFIGIVLYPTCLRENLSKLFLTRANLFSFFVKNNGTRTCSSLVNGHDVFFLWHVLSSW